MLADTDAQTMANVGFASAVAASRVHLRAHHPTDVIGGAAIGSVLGLGPAATGGPGHPGHPDTGGPAQAGAGEGNGRPHVVLKKL